MPAPNTAAPSLWRRGEHEVSLARLYILRAVALFFALNGCFTIPHMLLTASPTDRGMINGFLSGLWLMSFLSIRYPLRMLPIFLFEFAWKTVWLLAFGLPQFLSGTGSPRLTQDLLGIGLIPVLLIPIIPWGYVWRHYVKAPAERWR
jgi:hypothetical protein